ncbi:hypothetical protein ES708_19097 [subsurface metagenome]
MVPGTVIAHSPAHTEKYIGSPSIVVLPDGDYIVSHDHFGPGGRRLLYKETLIYRSVDRGKTWTKLATIQNQFWSTLFYFHGDLYLIGTRGGSSDILIRKSSDGGVNWTLPLDDQTGVIAEGHYHCAPIPVVEHDGRIWRAMEIADPEKSSAQAVMLSAPVEKDLLKASSWKISRGLGITRHWYNSNMETWIEGNAVVKPNGKMANIMRVQITGEYGLAAIIDVSDDGMTLSFDPQNGFIWLPGGTGKKFTIRFNSISGKYWSITNWIQPRDLKFLKHRDAGSIRNSVALVSSNNLIDWTIERVILYHPDPVKHAFQYTDWTYEGDDIIAVIRTSYDDGLGGAPNHHDANFMTFHRVVDFRKGENSGEE